jgi:hypothetical protein
MVYFPGGVNNTAIGAGSLYGDLGGNPGTAGSYNTAVGTNTLYFDSTGSENVAIGASALYFNVIGFNNTALGIRAGYNALGNANIFIGNGAGYYETGSDKLYIANSDTSTPLIGGDFSTGVVTINSLLTLPPTTTPATPVKGMIYFDNTINKLRCFDGTIWNDLW